MRSEVPTGFKKMDLPVVRFDSVKTTSGEELPPEDREFTIMPEGKQPELAVSLLFLV